MFKIGFEIIALRVAKANNRVQPVFKNFNYQFLITVRVILPIFITEK